VDASLAAVALANARWRRSSNLTVTKGAIMFGRVLPREVERRRTRVNNFQPRLIGMDVNPASTMGVLQKADRTLSDCADVNRVAALVAFVAGPQASSYPTHP
jgi:NAD(P)-dependent dehydrogenase (short-subunit alcohol dehydrogenase family)